MSNGTITKLFRGKNSYALLSLSNVALTGSTPLIIDGVTATDGMNIMLSNQTTPAQTGGYSFAISGGSYTFTLLTGQSLNTGTTYNGGQPFDFQVLQGNTNIGSWNYYDNGIIGVFNQYQTSGNSILHELVQVTPVSLNGGASSTATFTFVNTYTQLISLSPYVAASGTPTYIAFGNPTAQSVSAVTYNILNLSSTPVSSATLNLLVTGLNYV